MPWRKYKTVVSGKWSVRGGRGKESLKVGGGLSGKVGGGDAAEFGEGGGGVGDEGGLVALAAEGNGGEEGGVGLDQDAVGGSKGGGLADGLGGGVGEVAGEGEVEAERERAAGFVDAPGEAVHDAGRRGVTRVRLPVLGEQGEEFFPGVGGAELGFGLRRGERGGAAVDEDGLAGEGGNAELGEEGGALNVGGGVFDVVVVEADFADGDRAGVGGESGELGEGLRSGGGCLLGMDSGAGVDGGEIGRTGGFGDFECAVHLVGAVADADSEDGTDAGGVGAGEDSGEFVRGVHVEMGVRVDEGHGLGTEVRGSRFEVRGKADAAGEI